MKSSITKYVLFQILLLKYAVFAYRKSINNKDEYTSGCKVFIHDLGKPSPLLLKTNQTEKCDIYLPENKNGVLHFEIGHSLEVYCPGSELIIDDELTDLDSAIADCLYDDIFQIDQLKITLNQLICREHPVSVAQNLFRKSDEIEIGFKIGPKFIRNIFVRFDTKSLTTLYTKFLLTSSIESRQNGYARINFTQGTFYGDKISLHELYKAQRRTVNKLVSLPSESEKYIKNKGEYFLSRGHLVARAYFVYGAQQRMTFFYINTAPQWQTFNNGNWRYLEDRIRKYASLTGTDLTVYIGTYGIATLPHEETGEDVQLFLHEIGIPVPQLFWTVLYEENAKSGIALLGMNNPYQKNISNSIICDDIANNIKWAGWKRKNTKLGYSYACTIESFRKTVNFLPHFDVTSVLYPHY